MSNQQLREAFGQSASICRAFSEIYTQWCVRGPSLEASSAIAAMTQEHTGYAKAFDRLSEDTTTATCPIPGLRDVPASWPDLVGTSGTVEFALAAVVDGWRTSMEGAAVRNLTKMAQELDYHARFFRGWFQELDGDSGRAGDLFASARNTAEQEVRQWLSTPALRVVTGLNSPAWEERADRRASGGETCPSCGAGDARLVSSFGPSLMTTQFRCGGCNAFFEVVRWSSE